MKPIPARHPAPPQNAPGEAFRQAGQPALHRKPAEQGNSQRLGDDQPQHDRNSNRVFQVNDLKRNPGIGQREDGHNHKAAPGVQRIFQVFQRRDGLAGQLLKAAHFFGPVRLQFSPTAPKHLARSFQKRRKRPLAEIRFGERHQSQYHAGNGRVHACLVKSERSDRRCSRSVPAEVLFRCRPVLPQRRSSEQFCD